ncbi:leukotriene B4 receptor 1 [Triplophysa dalaica]|uniref:leukotriene B4 receptor 1 n=1 Tax=Triplophysa dalaica TaxID=1582913 RepID=UPI0024DFC82A|nr:leukotriene B4 receptor 1 [Triplophysa dalaica]
MSPLYSANDTIPDNLTTIENTIACVILGLCFLVGTPGNLLVVWTILKHVKQRSHTVVLILHLAAADLLVLITLPLWIYSLAHSWVFGEAACKAMVYVINACMYCSVFLITIMSVERFLAFRYPLKMLYWQDRTSISKILSMTWILSFILGIPVILFQYVNDDDEEKHCLYREYNSVSLEVFCISLETLLGFIIPFSILAICYWQVAKELHKMHFRIKPKSLFLIGGVVVAFILCWLPYHTLNIISAVLLLIEKSDEPSYILTIAGFISGTLAFISSSVNPVLYAFASKNFNGSLRKSGIVRFFQDLASQTHQAKDVVTQDSGLQDDKIVKDSNDVEQNELRDI